MGSSATDRDCLVVLWIRGWAVDVQRFRGAKSRAGDLMGFSGLDQDRVTGAQQKALFRNPDFDLSFDDREDLVRVRMI